MRYQLAVDACGRDIEPRPDDGGGGQSPATEQYGEDEIIVKTIPKNKVAATGGIPLAALLALGMIGGGMALLRRT